MGRTVLGRAGQGWGAVASKTIGLTCATAALLLPPARLPASPSAHPPDLLLAPPLPTPTPAAELEAALQAVGEAQGCLANQLAAVQQQLSSVAQDARDDDASTCPDDTTAATTDVSTSGSSSSSGRGFPSPSPSTAHLQQQQHLQKEQQRQRHWRQEREGRQQERRLLQANLAVMEQMLQQQRKHADECRDKLRRYGRALCG